MNDFAMNCRVTCKGQMGDGGGGGLSPLFWPYQDVPTVIEKKIIDPFLSEICV